MSLSRNPSPSTSTSTSSSTSTSTWETYLPLYIESLKNLPVSFTAKTLLMKGWKSDDKRINSVTPEITCEAMANLLTDEEKIRFLKYSEKEHSFACYLAYQLAIKFPDKTEYRAQACSFYHIINTPFKQKAKRKIDVTITNNIKKQKLRSPHVKTKIHPTTPGTARTTTSTSRTTTSIPPIIPSTARTTTSTPRTATSTARTTTSTPRTTTSIPPIIPSTARTATSTARTTTSTPRTTTSTPRTTNIIRELNDQIELEKKDAKTSILSSQNKGESKNTTANLSSTGYAFASPNPTIAPRSISARASSSASSVDANLLATYIDSIKNTSLSETIRTAIKQTWGLGDCDPRIEFLCQDISFEVTANILNDTEKDLLIVFDSTHLYPFACYLSYQFADHYRDADRELYRKYYTMASMFYELIHRPSHTQLSPPPREASTLSPQTQTEAKTSSTSSTSTSSTSSTSPTLPTLSTRPSRTLDAYVFDQDQALPPPKLPIAFLEELLSYFNDLEAEFAKLNKSNMSNALSSREKELKKTIEETIKKNWTRLNKQDYDNSKYDTTLLTTSLHPEEIEDIIDDQSIFEGNKYRNIWDKLSAFLALTRLYETGDMHERTKTKSVSDAPPIVSTTSNPNNTLHSVTILKPNLKLPILFLQQLLTYCVEIKHESVVEHIQSNNFDLLVKFAEDNIDGPSNSDVLLFNLLSTKEKEQLINALETNKPPFLKKDHYYDEIISELKKQMKKSHHTSPSLGSTHSTSTSPTEGNLRDYAQELTLDYLSSHWDTDTDPDPLLSISRRDLKQNATHRTSSSSTLPSMISVSAHSSMPSGTTASALDSVLSGTTASALNSILSSMTTSALSSTPSSTTVSSLSSTPPSSTTTSALSSILSSMTTSALSSTPSSTTISSLSSTPPSSTTTSALSSILSSTTTSALSSLPPRSTTVSSLSSTPPSSTTTSVLSSLPPSSTTVSSLSSTSSSMTGSPLSSNSVGTTATLMSSLPPSASKTNSIKPTVLPGEVLLKQGNETTLNRDELEAVVSYLSKQYLKDDSTRYRAADLEEHPTIGEYFSGNLTPTVGDVKAVIASINSYPPRKGTTGEGRGTTGGGGFGGGRPRSPGFSW